MPVRPKLFVKKQVYVPTVPGWFLLLSCLAGLSFVCVDRAYPFLAYDNPNDSDVFIIEGWVPDYVLDRGLVPFQEGRCRLLITTGGPLEVGAELASYKTDAELTAAQAHEDGLSKRADCRRVESSRGPGPNLCLGAGRQEMAGDESWREASEPGYEGSSHPQELHHIQSGPACHL